MPPYPLTNFQIRKYYQNEPRFYGVYSRDNLPKKIEDGTYVINLDEYSDVGTFVLQKSKSICFHSLWSWTCSWRNYGFYWK